MVNTFPVPVVYNSLPITGIVLVTLLITAIEQETVRTTDNEQCVVEAHCMCAVSYTHLRAHET